MDQIFINRDAFVLSCLVLVLRQQHCSPGWPRILYAAKDELKVPAPLASPGAHHHALQKLDFFYNTVSWSGVGWRAVTTPSS